MQHIEKALQKIEEIDKSLIELQEMGYDVTFNTTASLRHQLANNKGTGVQAQG